MEYGMLPEQDSLDFVSTVLFSLLLPCRALHGGEYLNIRLIWSSRRRGQVNRSSVDNLASSNDSSRLSLFSSSGDRLLHNEVIKPVGVGNWAVGVKSVIEIEPGCYPALEYLNINTSAPIHVARETE